MALTAGKIAEVMFENALETYEAQTQMMDLVDTFTPNAATMQNSGNTIWRPKQQHAPIIEGWDMSTLEQDVIEENYPAYLGLPKNDFVRLRADDLRDDSFWEKRGKQAGLQQATELNRTVAGMVANTGSLFFRSNATSGFDFAAEAQAILNERQTIKSEMRCFTFNDRDTKKFSSDLAGRATLQGRPSDTWKTGQIGANVAEFDIYTGSYLPTLVGGATPTGVTTSAYSFAPEAGSVNTTTNTVTNIDYREATIALDTVAGYNVGDVVTIVNAGTPIESVGLADKSKSGQSMTFRIVAISGLNVTVWPKPIAFSERPAAWVVPGYATGTGVLSYSEAACANVDTTITSGAAITRVNIDASAKTNIFWAKDSIEIVGGDAPLQLLSTYDGMKVINSTLKSGLNMYMAYDGDIATLNFRYRLFTWYGTTNANPSANGVGITY